MVDIIIPGLGNKAVRDDTNFIDADTLNIVDQPNVRLENINAPETQHVIQQEGFWPWSDDKVSVTNDEFLGNEVGDEIAALAKQGKYDQVDRYGRFGKYGREIGALRNNDGESVGARAAYEGITKTSVYDTDAIDTIRDFGVFDRLGPQGKDDMWDDSRNRLQTASKERFAGWKQLAVDESTLGNYNNAIETWHGPTYGVYRQDDVQFRHPGQTVQGEAYNSFTTGLQGGVNNIQESFFGAASAIGDLIDSKGIYDWGRIKAMSQQDDEKHLGRFVNNIGDINGAGDFGRYLTGMTGQMLPYLVGLFATGGVGGAIGGAVGTAITYGVPGLVYAGEIYNGMEGKMDEKHVGIAFAGGLIAGTVDRLSLNGLVSASNILKKDGMKQLANAYSKKFNVDSKTATDAVSKAYAGSQASLMKDLGIVQLGLNKKLAAQTIAKGFMQGAVREGITEVIQEGTIYASQIVGSNKKYNGDEFVNIVTNAAAGGFLLGGAFGGISSASNIDGFLKMQHDWRAADTDARAGHYTGTTETNLKTNSDAAIKNQRASGNGQIDTAKAANVEYEKGLKEDTIRGGGIKRFVAEGPGFYFRKLGDRIMNNYYPSANEKARYILATLTSNFANTTESRMSGVSHMKTKQMLQSAQSRKITIIENNLTNELGFKANKVGKAKASRMLRNYMRLKDSGKDITAEMKVANDALRVAAVQMNLLTDQNLEIVNNQAGETNKGVTNYFGKAVKLDPEMIKKNSEAFNELADYLGYDATQKADLYEAILGAPEGYQPSKLAKLGFKSTKQPGGLQKAKANIKDFPRINELMSDNHFDQMRAISKEDMNYALDMNRLGEKGSKVDAMLMELKNEMGKDWDPRIATWIKDSVAAGRGDYRKIKSKFGSDVQQWVLWFNTITQLDTSTLASLPELAMILYGHGKGSIGRDIAKATSGVGTKMMHDFETAKAKMFKDYNISEEEYISSVEDFYRLGYDQAHSSAAVLESSEAGVGSGAKFRKVTTDAFFKINLLQPFTDGSRVARLALAGQSIIGDMETLLSLKGVNNNMANDAYSRLRDLNVDPDVMAGEFQSFIDNMPEGIDINDENAVFKELRDNPAHAELLQMFDNAKMSYVDNLLARPTHEDRPLWYSNPHYKLLLQFTGFLSTFTANSLPRIYKDLKSSNPTAKLQAAAAVAAMLALGFMGQEMKDEIYDRKYGETPQGLEYLQRGLQSSGLIGTGERWLNMVHPVYGKAGILNFSPQKGISLGDSVTDQLGPSYGTGKKFVSFIDRLMGNRDTRDKGWDLIPGGRLARSWDSIAGNPTGDYLFDRR